VKRWRVYTYKVREGERKEEEKKNNNNNTIQFSNDS
jgi:hypothetical protein